ncbi:MAG: AAA family ATPase [Phycisphaerae bacterium]|nr:AAA family ATPase [Phycisphaerae bacterium]
MSRSPRKQSRGPFVLHVEVDLPNDPTERAAYPLNIPAIATLGTLPLHPAVTFLVGENGSGKSTILEAIAVAVGLNPEGGSRNFNFATRESHSDLYRHLRVARSSAMPRDLYFLRAESYFNVASEIEALDREPVSLPRIIDSYGGVSLHEQSHGESFFALFQHRLSGPGLYLLDEPEAALSPQRQIAILGLIHSLIGRGSQFVIATHSPIILAYPDSAIYSLDSSGVRQTAYRDSDPYRISRAFLENPELSIRELLRSDEPA